jgi:hypothetical protein
MRHKIEVVAAAIPSGASCPHPIGRVCLPAHQCGTLLGMARPSILRHHYFPLSSRRMDGQATGLLLNLLQLGHSPAVHLLAPTIASLRLEPEDGRPGNWCHGQPVPTFGHSPTVHLPAPLLRSPFRAGRWTVRQLLSGRPVAHPGQSPAVQPLAPTALSSFRSRRMDGQAIGVMPPPRRREMTTELPTNIQDDSASLAASIAARASFGTRR